MSSRDITELDFLGVMKTNQTPKPKFHKFLDRRRSFRDIQGAISKINPTIIKSLIASNANHTNSSTKSSSKEDHPLTIFYNGTVSILQLSKNKAESILKTAMETSSKKKAISVTPATTLRLKLFGQNILQGDLPIARSKSLQRFLEKRKERLVSTSPYSPTPT